MTPHSDVRRGLWVAIASFVLWGAMPLYWHLLKAVPSLQIVVHRIVWSAVLVVGWLAWQRRDWLSVALSKPRVGWMLALSGVLIAFNWGLYIWAVNAGHVVESSLGYFINPLMNVVLGVVFLRERLTRVQWLSTAVSGIAVSGIVSGITRLRSGLHDTPDDPGQKCVGVIERQRGPSAGPSRRFAGCKHGDGNHWVALAVHS